MPDASSRHPNYHKMLGYSVEARLIAHAFYFIAQMYGWRQEFKWRLLDLGVYSPDLDAYIRLARHPRLPPSIISHVKEFVSKICSDKSGPCWPRILLAAKTLAAVRIGIDPYDVLGFIDSGRGRDVIHVVLGESGRAHILQDFH